MRFSHARPHIYQSPPARGSRSLDARSVSPKHRELSAVRHYDATPPAMSFEVRRAGASDRTHILELLTELFGADPGTHADIETRFRWLYEDCPAGPALTWAAIDHETGLIAGCTSFFPRQIVYGDRVFRGALGGDGFVRPRFRRRGIGQAMHEASRRDMLEAGIDVMFGTPMPANFTPLKQVGGRDVSEVARYVRPGRLSMLGVPKGTLDDLGARLLTPLTRAHLDPMVPEDTRVEAVWNACRRIIGIASVRDAAFYTWRFLRSPSQKQRAYVISWRGTPIGACALEEVEEYIRVIDMIAPPDQFARALRAIAKFARGHRGVELRLTKEQAATHRLLLHGFIERGGKRPLNIVLPPGNPKADIFWHGRSWFVTWADTDRDFS